MLRFNITDQLILELISLEHAESLFSQLECNRDYLAQWLQWPNFLKTRQDYEAFIQRSQQEYADEQSIVFCIIYQGQAIGTAAYIDLRKDLNKAEIGYWIAADSQGLGLATQVCRFLIDYAFAELGLTKIEASVAVGNFKSEALCKRLDMLVEGVIAQDERINGQLLDHTKFACFRR